MWQYAGSRCDGGSREPTAPLGLVQARAGLPFDTEAPDGQPRVGCEAHGRGAGEGRAAGPWRFRGHRRGAMQYNPVVIVGRVPPWVGLGLSTVGL